MSAVTTDKISRQMTLYATAQSARAARNLRPASLRVRLTLAILGIAVALVVVEAALRLLGPRAPFVNSLSSIASFQTYHPIYGFFHRPGASGWIQTPEFTSFVQISSQGLREREIAIPKPPSLFRILMLGDSFVEGSQVAAELTVSRRLEVELRESTGAEVEVVNAGNAGFGTAQELLFLEHEGATFQPDLVVLVFFVDNDLPDNGHAVSVERNLDTSRRPFFVPDGRGGVHLLPIASPPSDATARVKTALRSFSLTYNLVENVALWQEARDHENQQIGKNRPTYLIEPPPEWLEAWVVTESLIARARDAARGLGTEMLLVVAPSNYQVSDEAWRWLVAGTQDRGRRYDREAPNRRVAEIVERTGVRSHDLLPTVRAAVSRITPLYYPDDGHWTPAGHSLGARAIASYLISNGLVPTPPR